MQKKDDKVGNKTAYKEKRQRKIKRERERERERSKQIRKKKQVQILARVHMQKTKELQDYI